MYFKNSEIVKRAQCLTEDNVDNARVSWWCCADAKQHTYNFLRGDNEKDKSFRRLSCLSEFPTKTIPDELNKNDLLEMNGHVFTMEELIVFVKEQYPSIVMPPNYEYVLGKNTSVSITNEYWSLLSEYDSGIDAVDAVTYEKLLVSACSYEHLDVLYYMYKMGGAATCKQIATKYGKQICIRCMLMVRNIILQRFGFYFQRLKIRKKLKIEHMIAVIISRFICFLLTWQRKILTRIFWN